MYVCPQDFGKVYIGRGLAYSDEILQCGRSRESVRSSPLLVNFGSGVYPLSQKLKNFGIAYLVDCLHDWAEIL